MRTIFWLAFTGLLVTATAEAVPQKARRLVTRPAVKVVDKPAAPKPPTSPGIMVPKAIDLVKPTAAEARAHAVWTLRAALNVAALQCQYSPFLRTVDNYNQMLKKHGDELASAQAMMATHFTRTVKRGGLAAFDRYNTRSYNSFSTLDAQYNFCWTAGQVGMALRLANAGEMSRVAELALPAIRGALGFVPPAAGLMVPAMAPLPDFQLAIFVDSEAV